MCANVSYLIVRRELLGLLTAALSRVGTIEISASEFITLRTFLTSRDARPTDNARLAYEVVVARCYELTAPVAPPPPPFRAAPAGP